MLSTIPLPPNPFEYGTDSPDTNFTEVEVIEIFQNWSSGFSNAILSYPPVRLEYTALAQKCAISHGLANNAWTASG